MVFSHLGFHVKIIVFCVWIFVTMNEIVSGSCLHDVLKVKNGKACSKPINPPPLNISEYYKNWYQSVFLHETFNHWKEYHGYSRILLYKWSSIVQWIRLSSLEHKDESIF
jgi:hypothetical protein